MYSSENEHNTVPVGRSWSPYDQGMRKSWCHQTRSLEQKHGEVKAQALEGRTLASCHLKLVEDPHRAGEWAQKIRSCSAGTSERVRGGGSGSVERSWRGPRWCWYIRPRGWRESKHTKRRKFLFPSSCPSVSLFRAPVRKPPDQWRSTVSRVPGLVLQSGLNKGVWSWVSGLRTCSDCIAVAEPRSSAHPLACWGREREDWPFPLVIEYGLPELFSQYYTHGEEAILRVEIQAILDRMNGCWGRKMPNIYCGLLGREVLVEHWWMLVSFSFLYKYMELTLLVLLQH